VSCPRLAGLDRGSLFRTSPLTPAHPSSSRPRHRTDLWDCGNGDIYGRCRLRGNCTASHDLIKIVLGQHPFPGDFASREPAITKLVGEPTWLAAEACSRLIEGEKQWCCGGQGDSTPKNVDGPLTLVAGACCRYRAAVVLKNDPQTPRCRCSARSTSRTLPAVTGRCKPKPLLYN
jgi:hypothetical protein